MNQQRRRLYRSSPLPLVRLSDLLQDEERLEEYFSNRTLRRQESIRNDPREVLFEYPPLRQYSRTTVFNLYDMFISFYPRTQSIVRDRLRQYLRLSRIPSIPQTIFFLSVVPLQRLIPELLPMNMF